MATTLRDAHTEYAHRLITGEIPECEVPRTVEQAEAFLADLPDAKEVGIQFDWGAFRDHVIHTVESGWTVDPKTAAVTLKECDGVPEAVQLKLRGFAGIPEELFKEGDAVHTVDAENHHKATVTKRRKNGTFTIKLESDSTAVVMTREGLTHKNTIRWKII